jgi:hypothetical protein
VCGYSRSGRSKPELLLASACQRAVRCHSGCSPRSQVSARGSKGSPTAAQYAAIVAAGRVTRSSESMTTGGFPSALPIAVCISHSRFMPMALMVIGGNRA